MKKTIPKETEMFNLEYLIGNRVVETVLYNESRVLCLWKKNKLSNSSHRLGTFRLTPVKVSK